VSNKEIQQATTDITNLMVLRQARIRHKAKAESCTQAKRAAFHELQTWVQDLRNTARFAFKKNPQMLEAFGVTVRAAV
jgi:cell division inhibitor SulA